MSHFCEIFAMAAKSRDCAGLAPPNPRFTWTPWVRALLYAVGGHVDNVDVMLCWGFKVLMRIYDNFWGLL